MKFNFYSTEKSKKSGPPINSKVKGSMIREKLAFQVLLLLFIGASFVTNAQTYRTSAPIEPAAIAEQPANTTACLASDASFTIKTTNAVSHQWQVDQGSGFDDIKETPPYSGTKTATLAISGVTAEMYNYSYRVVAEGAESSVVISKSVVLLVPVGPFTTQPVPSTVCSGSNATFTVAATGGSNFRWQVNTGTSFSNITIADPYSVVTNSTTSTLTITGASTTLSGYKYRCVVFAGCADVNSNEALLTVNPVGKWLGATNDEWATGSNWCGGVPTATTDVVISGAASLPQINGIGYDAFCRNLTISGGAKLYVNDGTLKINGSVTAASEDFIRTAVTSFTGNNQVIPAGDYGDLQMEGSGEMTLAGNVRVAQLLILGGGRIALGNYDLVVAAAGEMHHNVYSSFVVTNGTGQLKKEGVGSQKVTFPVGTSPEPVGISSLGVPPGSYTPLQISNSGTVDVFGVRVVTGVWDAYTGDAHSGTKLTTRNVDKTWFVTEGTALGSVATLTFNWNEAEQQPSFNGTACFGSHYTGGKWVQGTSGEAELGNELGQDYYSISLTGVTTFSPFGVGTAGSALPVKLLSFGAASNAEEVSLSWKTVNEINTAGFDVEASKDAVDFKKVGFVTSLDKNSAVVSDYYFNTPYLSGAPTSYFRLKMLDQDGSFSYSRIVTVHKEGVASDYQIFPNPLNNEDLTVKSAGAKTGQVQITVLDIRGQVVYQSQVDAASLNADSVLIPTKWLTHGSNYVMKITDPKTGVNQTFKFFKK